MSDLRHRLSTASARMRDWRMVAACALVGGMILGAAAVYIALTAEWNGVTPEEKNCASYVQGRIAWSDERNTQWEESWLNRLCEGTKRPVQPGLCFNTIRNIPLGRGAVIQQDWKDAVALCTGANDAQDRVSCYREGVGRGLHFRDAIAECANSRRIAGRTACERLVQDNIAWNAKGDTRWTAERLDALCADTENPTQPLLCFERLYRGTGPWDDVIADVSRRAIQLCAGTESASKTASCVAENIAKLKDADPETDLQIRDPGEPAKLPQSGNDGLFNAVRRACNPSRPTDRGEQCKKFVQGDIPWSARGYKDWEPAVLDELCGSTRAPQQPGLCFARAFNGEIADDAKGESRWAYAVQLCAGTDDADTRLSCYRLERDAGKDSRAAIKACKDTEQD
jgi:hypothetical protein